MPVSAPPFPRSQQVVTLLRSPEKEAQFASITAPLRLGVETFSRADVMRDAKRVFAVPEPPAQAPAVASWAGAHPDGVFEGVGLSDAREVQRQRSAGMGRGRSRVVN